MGNPARATMSFNTMGRSGVAVLTLAGSLVLHAAVGAGGMWLARRTPDRRIELKPALAGETFEIAGVDVPAEVEPVEQQGGDSTAAPMRIAPRTVAVPRRVAPLPLTYGAVGDRTASSLLVTLSRAFPQAASTDWVWRTAPLGDAGSATMEVELDEAGNVARWSLGPGASPALRQAMVRMMALVGSRPFIATGPVTRLHVEARVSTDAVREGTDAVYALHSEHEGDEGKAYFSLSMGRRVDLVIRVLR